MKKFYFSASAALLLIFCGCSSAKRETKKRIGFGLPDGLVEYKKITAENLYLNLISKPLLRAGDRAELIFALRNAGIKRVNIPEWLQNEPENIKLFIQPFLPGMSAPDPDSWIELVEPVKYPVIHSPLILMPDNQAMISKNLEFISKMSIASGMERRFFLKAQINLKSLNTESETVVLRVLSKSSAKGENEK